MKLFYTMLMVCWAFYAQAQQTVVEIIVDSDIHTTLETAVIEVGLVDALSGPGPFTVFAPTDAAFAEIDPDVLNALLADPTGDLQKILRYHVVGAEIPSSALSDGDKATSLLGQMVEASVNMSMDTIMINNAMVTIANLTADNGIVHVIDAVLLPPAATVVDVVANSEVHNTLETAVVAADLAGALSGDGPFTVFAPTDAAFAALDPGLLGDLLADPTGNLQKILRYHVVGANAVSSTLSDGDSPRTLLGQNATVGIENDMVMINDAMVTITDIETFNGVVHVIDAVLLPPAATVVDVVVNSEVHEILETAVVAAELAGALSGDGPFTVFAPTDAAFAEIDSDVINALFADPTGDLQKILRYHVVGANAVSSALSDGDSPRTLLGQNATVGIDNDVVMINDAMVTITDIETFNGVVHVIDAVLLPPAATVVDVVVNSEVHETLETAVVAADLAGALSGDGPFTVFAPTDAAFAALDPALLSDLLADPTGDLQKILRYHVVGANAVSSTLSDGDSPRTLLGQNATVGIENDMVMINDAMVTITDIETFNGVVHVIDAVILPAATITDYVVGDEELSTLESVVIDAELAETLGGEGPFTLFAPIDTAFSSFAEVNPDVFADLLADPTGDLRNVLLYHAAEGIVLSSDLEDEQNIPSLFDNQNIVVDLQPTLVLLNGYAVVITPDIETFNGVIHKINNLLFPQLTNLEELNRVSVEVFPNPAANYLTLTMPSEFENQEINAQLIGVEGKVVDSWLINNSNTELDVQGLARGTYFLLLSTDTDFAITKVMLK